MSPSNEQRKAALAEARAETEEIFTRWDRVECIQEIGKKHDVIIPVNLACDLVSEFEPKTKQKTTGEKAMPKHRYNEQGERILVKLPAAGDGTVVTACYDEDEERMYLRHYNSRGKVRAEIPIDEGEWKKLSAVEVDEWEDNDDDDDDEEEDNE